MDMEQALRARLLAAAPVTAALWKNPENNDLPAIYWVERPQGNGLPAITLQMVADNRQQHMEGFDGAQPATVQIDAWAPTYEQAKALKETVIAALAPSHSANGIKFYRGFFTARDLSERTETQFIYCQSIDYSFHYAPAQ